MAAGTRIGRANDGAQCSLEHADLLRTEVAPRPWRLEDTGEAGRARLKAIVGFELVAEQVEVKLTLGQNQVEGNVLGAIEGLRAVGSAEALAVADWMEQALQQRRSQRGT
jgi:predicted FMN-binding regulatory protein PaiB